MSVELIQILLNTLEPNTAIVKESQLQLEKCNPNPEFPLLLGQIICDSHNHPKQLDLISVVALSKCIKNHYG